MKVAQSKEIQPRQFSGQEMLSWFLLMVIYNDKSLLKREMGWSWWPTSLSQHLGDGDRWISMNLIVNSESDRVR